MFNPAQGALLDRAAPNDPSRPGMRRCSDARSECARRAQDLHRVGHSMPSRPLFPPIVIASNGVAALLAHLPSSLLSITSSR